MRTKEEVEELLAKLRSRGDCFGIASDPEQLEVFSQLAWERYHTDPTKEGLDELIATLTAELQALLQMALEIQITFPTIALIIDLAVELAWNYFNDRKLLQLELQDWRLAEPN